MESEVSPLALLTRDAWHHVLVRLEHPLDFRNAANTHSLFRLILESDLKQNWMSALFFACLPHFSKFMSRSELLNLRRISKGAKSTVDSFLETSQFNGTYPLFKLALWGYLDPANDQQNIYTLLEEMWPLQITKVVGLSISCNELQETFRDCRPFFRAYGSQVLELRLKYNDDIAPHPLRSLELLRDILKYVPNLENLCFRARCDLPELEVPHQPWIDRVERFWRENPLPELPHLHSLELHMAKYRSGSGLYACPTIRAFLQAYGSHLHKLDISHTPIMPRVVMPAMEDLQVWLYSAEDLANLQACQAPLVWMKIIIGDTCPITPSQFFLAMETFKATLYSLIVDNNSWEFGRIDRLPEQVDLPHLVALELSGRFNGSTGPSFPFLYNFQRLKILEIMLECPPQRESQEEEEYQEDSGDSHGKPMFSDSHSPDLKDLRRSQVWDRLPVLQQMRVIVWPNPTTMNFTAISRSEF